MTLYCTLFYVIAHTPIYDTLRYLVLPKKGESAPNDETPDQSITIYGTFLSLLPLLHNGKETCPNLFEHV